MATGIQGTPPKGGRVGFPLLVNYASFFHLRSHGCIMVHLTWDPDRYDEISEHQLFLCTWSIWNHTDFAEVRVFAFLAAPDLRSLCAVCFCIHIDLKIFWKDLMNPEELRVDQSTETFFGLVGSLSTGAAEAEVHTGAQSVGVQVYDDPLQPVTPRDDLFGLSSPHDETGHVEQSSVHSIGHGSKSVEQRVADVAMSKTDYNRALFEVRLNAVGDSELKLPWEQGVWKAIFTDDDSDVFPSVIPPVPGEYLSQAAAVQPESSDATEPAEKSLARSSIVSDPKMPFYSFAIRVLPDRDALEETEKVWLVALNKWHQVFEILSYPGELGRVILQELVTGEHADGSGALRDSLGIKSPRTAVKRAQTMIHFLTWLQVHVSNWNPWDRLHCLQYLQPDGHRRTSASRGMALLEAFRFSKYVLGIPIPEQLLNDPQLKGRAQRMMAGKSSYNPARPLKVSELAFLETSMQKPLDPIDRYIYIYAGIRYFCHTVTFEMVRFEIHSPDLD